MYRLASVVSGLVLALVMSLPEGAPAGTRPFQGCKAHPSEETCSFSDPFVEDCSADSALVAYAFSPDNFITVGLRYSPSCLSAWTVVRNDIRVPGRLRATIVSSDGVGSARDDFLSAVSEMLYVGPERPDRTVQAIGRLFDSTTGKVRSLAQTPFIDPSPW